MVKLPKQVGPASSPSGAIDAFLEQARTAPAKMDPGRGRLVFALDATASRQPTWDLATSLQGHMFETAESLGGLDVQLVYFRGFSECRASPFMRDGRGLAGAMRRIGVAAGRTQLNRVLAHVRDESASGRVAAMIFVGDAVEEDPQTLMITAGEMALRGTKAFMFQEGRNAAAAGAFKGIARVTGGAYAPFDANAPATLAALLAAAAAYSAGGMHALQAIAGSAGDPAVKALLAQIR